MNRKCLVLMIAFAVCLAGIFGCAGKSDLERGEDAMAKGAYGQALESFLQALNKDSLNPQVHYKLCLAYASLDSVDEALGHYARLVGLGSSLKDDRELRGLMAGMLGVEAYPSSTIPMPGLNQFKGAFSPDGGMVAVAASKRDRADIYLMNLDGSDVRKVVTGGMNTDPVFSPDGKSLAFVSDRDGDEDLYICDLATNKIRRLTDNSAQDLAPAYSPGGDEIVFVSNMDDPNKWEIYVVNIQSGRIGRLTDNIYWDGFPKFTQNGQSIVFSSKRGESEDIYAMRPDGKGLEMLFSSPADDNDPTLVNENLFFKSQMDGEWEIYRYNVKTKQLLRLTYNDAPDWNPRVSPDGAHVLLTRKAAQRWVLHLTSVSEPVSCEYILAATINRKK